MIGRLTLDGERPHNPDWYDAVTVARAVRGDETRPLSPAEKRGVIAERYRLGHALSVIADDLGEHYHVVRDAVDALLARDPGARRPE